MKKTFPFTRDATHMAPCSCPIPAFLELRDVTFTTTLVLVDCEQAASKILILWRPDRIPVPFRNLGRPNSETLQAVAHARVSISRFLFNYCTYTYVRVFIDIHVCTQKKRCIHPYRPMYIHTYIHTYIPTHIHTYMHPYIHTPIHTYIYACVHTYIYICVCTCLCVFERVCV